MCTFHIQGYPTSRVTGHESYHNKHIALETPVSKAPPKPLRVCVLCVCACACVFCALLTGQQLDDSSENESVSLLEPEELEDEDEEADAA